MRSKSQFPINLNFKLILICFFFLFLIFLIPRSAFSPAASTQKASSSLHASKLASPENQESPENQDSLENQGFSEKQDSPGNQESPENQESKTAAQACDPGKTQSCDKIPASLANALVHYVTTNVTPQQTWKEISVSMRVLEKKSPCNFLVFGLGHDSLMWTALNHGGRTVFLEEDSSWIKQIHRQLPSLESYHVTYDTKVTQADELLETGMREECQVVGDPRSSKCQLALKGFPKEVYEMEWDLIMVDAPTGYHDEAPGRMAAIYTAGLIARNKEEGETDVFVHDVDRVVEDKFSNTFLCEGYMVEQEGRIRHFTIPSHRARTGRPFCPH